MTKTADILETTARYFWRDGLVQAQDHTIFACGPSTGHAVVPIAFCIDTATAKWLVEAANKAFKDIGEPS